MFITAPQGHLEGSASRAPWACTECSQATVGGVAPGRESFVRREIASAARQRLEATNRSIRLPDLEGAVGLRAAPQPSGVAGDRCAGRGQGEGTVRRRQE